MYFEKLTIWNYGPLRDLEFVFSPSGINLIFGSNGSGKTQLAGAIIASLIGPKQFQFSENYTDKRASEIKLSIREGNQHETITFSLDNENRIQGYNKSTNYDKWPLESLQDRLIKHLIEPNQLPIIFNPDEEVSLASIPYEKYKIIDQLLQADNNTLELWEGIKKYLVSEKGKLNQLERVVSEGQKKVFKLAQEYINRADCPYSIPLILDSPFWFLDPGGRGFPIKLIEAISKKDQVILLSQMPDQVLVNLATNHYYLPQPKKEISPIYYKYGGLKKSSSPKPYIVTEGKTDWKHIKAALIQFRSQYEFRNLDVDFFEHDENQPMGSAELLKFCEQYSKLPQPRPIICIFDRDEDGISRKVMPPDGDYKDWGNNVFSFTIPLPPHRKDHPDICIEFYYKNEDVKRLDNNGRRLFVSTEFDMRSGRHITDNLNCTILNKLNRFTVIDNNVFDAQNNNMALSKDDFASAILNQLSGFNDVDFRYFRLILNLIQNIARLHDSEY